MSQVRSDWHEVQVRSAAKTGRCYYAGLMACGSVWACPVCAAKIQQVRADEVRRAIAAAGRLGLAPWLLTLTVPHTRHDDLAGLLKAFTGSLGTLFKGRGWRSLAGRWPSLRTPGIARSKSATARDQRGQLRRKQARLIGSARRGIVRR